MICLLGRETKLFTQDFHRLKYHADWSRGDIMIEGHDQATFWSQEPWTSADWSSKSFLNKNCWFIWMMCTFTLKLNIFMIFNSVMNPNSRWVECLHAVHKNSNWVSASSSCPENIKQSVFIPDDQLTTWPKVSGRSVMSTDATFHFTFTCNDAQHFNSRGCCSFSPHLVNHYTELPGIWIASQTGLHLVLFWIVCTYVRYKRTLDI